MLYVVRMCGALYAKYTEKNKKKTIPASLVQQAEAVALPLARHLAQLRGMSVHFAI